MGVVEAPSGSRERCWDAWLAGFGHEDEVDCTHACVSPGPAFPRTLRGRKKGSLDW